jgi:hypothetical protein
MRERRRRTEGRRGGRREGDMGGHRRHRRGEGEGEGRHREGDGRRDTPREPHHDTHQDTASSERMTGGADPPPVPSPAPPAEPHVRSTQAPGNLPRRPTGPDGKTPIGSLPARTPGTGFSTHFINTYKHIKHEQELGHRSKGMLEKRIDALRGKDGGKEKIREPEKLKKDGGKKDREHEGRREHGNSGRHRNDRERPDEGYGSRDVASHDNPQNDAQNRYEDRGCTQHADVRGRPPTPCAPRRLSPVDAEASRGRTRAPCPVRAQPSVHLQPPSMPSSLNLTAHASRQTSAGHASPHDSLFTASQRKMPQGGGTPESQHRSGHVSPFDDEHARARSPSPATPRYDSDRATQRGGGTSASQHRPGHISPFDDELYRSPSPSPSRHRPASPATSHFDSRLSSHHASHYGDSPAPSRATARDSDRTASPPYPGSSADGSGSPSPILMPQPNMPPPLPSAGARATPLNNAALLAELAGSPKLRRVASSDRNDKSAARAGEVKDEEPTYKATPHSQHVENVERSQTSVWSEKDDGEKEAQRAKAFRDNLEASLQGFGKGG